MFISKILKWFGGILLAFVLLIVAAVIIVPRVIDPNDYRDQITEIAREHTGRELLLEGDLSMSVFPWLGIRTEGLSLSQPEEIGGAMVQVDTAQLRIKLLPLLGKRVEIDTVILKKPQISLITLENGIDSLTGLTDDEAAEEEPPEADTPESAIALVIQGIQLTDGSFELDDRQEGKRIQIKDLQLVTGNLIGSKPASIKLSGSMLDLSDTTLEPVPLNFDLTGKARIDTKSLLASAQNLAAKIEYAEYSVDASIDQFSFDTEKTALSIESISVETDFQGQSIQLNVPSVSANMDAQNASIPKIEATVGNLVAAINQLEVKDFADNLAASGTIDIPIFDAANLLKKLDIDYETADPSVLKAVGFNTGFTAGKNHVNLNSINVQLDETKLNGSFTASGFEEEGAIPALKFALAMNSLNMDHYLPPEELEEEEEEAGSFDTAALQLPMAAFKDVNANGTFKADQLVSGGVTLTDIDVVVESTPGKVSITPSADLYDGELAGAIVFTEEDEVSQLRVQNTIGIVDLAKLLTDAEISEQLSGFGSFDVDLLITERDGVQSNEGTITLSAQDGSLKGVDIKKMIENAYSKYQAFTGGSTANTEAGESSEDDSTGFAELGGTFHLKDFKLTNDDFKIAAPFFRVAGGGSLDLNAQDIDYAIDVSIVKSVAGQGGEAVDKLNGFTLPVKLSGDMLSPKYSLDIKSLYSSLAKQKVNEKKAELLQEHLGIENGGDLSVKDAAKEALFNRLSKDDKKSETESAEEQEEPEDLEDELKNTLKGLFR